MNTKHTPFNVIIEDNGRFLPYDVMPYFLREYRKETKNQPDLDNFEEVVKWLDSEARYMYWARTQYEIIIVDWPCQKVTEKWDIYKQLEMNLHLITRVFIDNVKKTSNKK